MKRFILLVSTLTACVIQGLIVSDTSPTDVTSIWDHVTKLEQTVNGEIVAMKIEMRKREEEFAKLQTENALLRASLNLTVLDKMGSDVKTCLSEIHRQENSTSFALQGIKNDLKSVTESLSNASSSLSTGTSGSSNVYYQVQLQTSRLSLRSDTTLIFDDVLANVGNGYNSTTGVFTAPASGPYLLWVHVLGVVSMTDSVLDIFLHKNDLQIAAGYAKISPILGYNDVSITTITHLKMGDRVWYKGVFPVTVHGNMYSGYGGIMLTAQ